MGISNNHLKNYCQADVNSGREMCKYLSHKMSSGGYVPVCTKLCPAQQGKSVNSWSGGDNCLGLPMYLYVEVGYDVEK